ncbi:MAG: class IV adenylate cyclase [Planctomycetales bacterium]
MLEVELKFALTDPSATRRELQQLTLGPGTTQTQRDAYFNHPAKDFAQTDEALRIRSVGEKNFVTYKGPMRDAQTKTREEIETPLGDGAQVAAEFSEVLVKLGFRPVRVVAKVRTTWHLHWNERDWEIAWDEVEGLGTYLEIETQADEAGYPGAKEAILELAAALKLGTQERRSYLRLLLEKSAG